MLFGRYKINLTTSSGTASFNTPKFSMGYLRQFIVKSATGSTTFDLQLIDPLGFDVFSSNDINTVGIMGLITMHKVDVPIIGIYTFKILNASRDEAFTGFLMVQED